MITPQVLIALALLLPAAGAVGVLLTGRWPNLREAVSTAATLATFAAVVALVPLVGAGGRPQLEVLTVLPGLVLAFEVEPLGMVYALVASGLWIVTSLYAIGYMRGHGEKHLTRFFAFFAVAIGAALGIAFARNLFTLFLFYELLTLSTFPLVTHHGDDEARRAGRVYLGILLSTSIGFLLLAVIWTAQVAGTLEFAGGGILRGAVADGRLTQGMAGLLLACYAFGIGKAALMPFHRWLPAAMVAPTPVSALLHAVAVVKAGVFAVLKVVVYVFGLELLRREDLSLWLMVVAAVTLLTASVVALREDNLKKRLAYSTISQLAYIVLGGALATADGVIGGGMHIAMHAVGKITLFFCAGAIYVAAHKTQVSELDGIGRTMPWTMTAFFLASLSIIGLPPFGGAWSKWYIALGAVEAEHLIFVAVLMVSSLLSIGYLMPVVARAFFRPSAEVSGEQLRGDGHSWLGESPPRKGAIHEAPLLCVVPLCVTAVGSLVLFFYAEDLYRWLAPIVAGGS